MSPMKGAVTFVCGLNSTIFLFGLGCVTELRKISLHILDKIKLVMLVSFVKFV